MNKETYISDVDDNGLEINITVTSNQSDLLENEKILKEVTELALSKKFPGFVGASEPSKNAKDWVFIFSIPDYFDPDDMLVVNPLAGEKINKILVNLQ